MAHKAMWEAKTEKLIEKNIVKNRMADMQRRTASNLEQRKARLAALLEAEDRIYEQEFNDNMETPEQVREKMFQRLTDLKGKREAERQAEVKRRQDMQFKMANDSLRNEDQKFYNYGTAIEREKQLIDKRRKIEQKMIEEQVYAQLWALDAQKKQEREMAEAREKQDKIKDTMAVLDWQKNTRDLQRQQEAELIKKEQAMLRTQWAVEEEKEKADTQQRFLLNRERNLELISHNATEKELREQAQHHDRLRDKDLLGNALAREKAMEQLEADERLARRKEIQELQSHYNQMTSDKQAHERMIDGLVDEESNKIWEAREQQWRREDQAKINLLKNVYANREADVLLKQKLKQEGDWLKNYEKEQIDNDIDRQNRAFEQKAINDALSRKTHQTDILRQVGERDRTMRRDLQEKMFEERAAKLAEIEYTRRINDEKGTNNQMLDTWKNTVSGY